MKDIQKYVQQKLKKLQYKIQHSKTFKSLILLRSEKMSPPIADRIWFLPYCLLKNL